MTATRMSCPGGGQAPTRDNGVFGGTCATCGGLFKLRKDRAVRHHQVMAPAVDYSWADPTPDLVDLNAQGGATPEPAPATDALGHYMGEAEAALENVQASLQPALDSLDLQDTSVVYLVAWCQAQRRILKAVEDQATLYAGQNLSVPRTGELADGRTYTLRKGVDRKSWDRESWERDARHAIIRESVPQGLEVIDTSTGEVVETARHLAQRVAAAAQQVAGSAPPRVTSLKALGLQVDEYCATSPGPWQVQFQDPEPTAPTTED